MRNAVIGLCAAAVLSFCGLLPGQSREISSLLPCRTIVVDRQDGAVTVSSDNDLFGAGSDYAAALENLCRSAPGDVFFGTVSAVVLCDEAVGQLSAVARDTRLRPAAQLCVLSGDAELETLTPFLSAHTGNLTLAQLRTCAAEQHEIELPRLYEGGGRYRFG